MEWLDRLDAGGDGNALLTELLDETEGYEAREELVERAAEDDLHLERVRRALVARGARASDVSRVFTRLQQRARELVRDRSRAPDALPLPSPVPMQIPSGWRADAGGVWRETDKGEQVACYVPTWVEARCIDSDTGTESWVLAWEERGRVRRVQCPRSQAQTARRLVELADRSYPVSSDTAGVLVAWLEAYVARNAIDVRRTVRRLGWVRGQLRWGSEGVDLSEEGMDRIASACRERRHSEAARALHDLRMRYPVLMAAYCVSLASVALEPLGAHGCVLSMDGRTSAGKTTALRMAASAWGDPCERTGLVFSWDWTPYFAQRCASQLHHLPLCVDDTRRFKGAPGQLSDCVYDLTQGRERGRMTSGRSAQEQRTWRLNTLSTGEDPLGQSSTAGGLRARVLQVFGSPFGGSAPEDVEACNRAVRAHHGVDGPAFARALDVDRLRGLVERVRPRVEGDVAGRLAEHAAIIMATGWAAAEWLGWEVPGEDVAAMVWEALRPGVLQADADADPAERGWRDLQAWLVSQMQSIDHPGRTGNPPAQWVAGADMETWHVFSHTLRRWASEAGLNAATMLRSWEADGRLVRREPGNRTSKVMIGGGRARVYVLRRDED